MEIPETDVPNRLKNPKNTICGFVIDTALIIDAVQRAVAEHDEDGCMEFLTCR